MLGLTESEVVLPVSSLCAAALKLKRGPDANPNSDDVAGLEVKEKAGLDADCAVMLAEVVSAAVVAAKVVAGLLKLKRPVVGAPV